MQRKAARQDGLLLHIIKEVRGEVQNILPFIPVHIPGKVP